ncbi:MAG: 1-deoxy-D-xylulose-5-phosphate synthase [Oscillospiraceae bacterium]|jgi:1-deoxy-D-xylulose-5-phosphate synthase|nr:1-deoxy-D-xylulose-5-phosphate synthase [Oscillospiraceae bacterium]
MNSILKKVKSPDDLKKLKDYELTILADEIRKVLIDTVSENGGHLSPNLGVVELTIAMHKVFNSPKDQFVWDVGHQVYTHKLITGRQDDFCKLRMEDGLSGFPNPNESEHDIFFQGHSSASISSAFGLSMAKKLLNDPNYTVAVIGDGALTGGLAFEGLNNAGRSKNAKLIIILNDNDMSISKNVGSIAKYLAAIRTKPQYYAIKSNIEDSVMNIPKGGEMLYEKISKAKKALKNYMYESTLFEYMGFRYLGPIDGHDISAVCDALEGAKSLECPVLLHVKTIKGKGYDFAEKLPTQFHGTPKFDIETGEPISGANSFSSKFGKYLCKHAEDDKRICAITAAMSFGTGLETFKENYKPRFFDVGLAEEHAVTFASGLAKNGMLPVFAVYSTFLQRCYDQLVHDAALQNQKLVLAIDRAGFVGDDGETHQGILDVAFLNSIPGIRVYSPSSFNELEMNLNRALYEDPGVVAVRYPRGNEGEFPVDYKCVDEPFTMYGDEGAKNVIVTYGRLFSEAIKAMEKLQKKGINVKILKLNRVKPIDINAVKSVLNDESIFFFEEGVRSGGAGESFALKLLENGFKGQYKLRAVEDKFVESASMPTLLKKYKFDSEGMVDLIAGSTKT